MPSSEALGRLGHLSTDLPTAAWQRLERILERFEDAWVRGERPAIEDYLREAAEDRSALLVELVHADLEYRLRAGEAVRVEDYLGTFPELCDILHAELELVAAEFLGKEGRGEMVRLEDYRARFPQLAGQFESAVATRRARAAGEVPSARMAIQQGQARDGPTLPPAANLAETATRPAAAAPATGQAGPGPSTAEPGAPTTQGGAAALLPGVCVPGFEVLVVLGEGGMGTVYQARQAGLNRLVALKMIRREYAADPQALARFRAEAEAIARLAHPHIVAVHAWGERDGIPYFVLEFCTGGSLDKAIEGQPQPPQEAARLVEKLARAVQAAHDVGIVHRDLKPANVLLAPHGDEPALNTAWGIPKVADFGLCRLLQTHEQRTVEGTVAGSPPYMAPEQAEGRIKDIGPATDVWAMGAILYELLAGRPPFQGTNIPAILRAVSYDEPPRPGELQAGVPPGLEAICLCCLRKRPKARYPRAADLAEALQGWLSQAAASTRAPPKKPVSERRSAGRSRGWLAVGLLLLGLLGLAGWAWFGRAGLPTAAPSPPGDPHRGTPGVAAKPLTIHLHVWRLAQQGFNIKPCELGGRGGAFRVRLNEQVEPKAEFSEPVYAYMLAFNPAEKATDLEQFIPGGEEHAPPQKDAKLDPKKWITLNDGEGLQAFAVVASRQPLPPYAQWRKERPALPWQKTRAMSGVVLRSDGQITDEFFGAGVSRAKQDPAGDRVAIERLAAWLKSLKDVEAVSVIGFAVDRAD
jgi:serine/threonine protein kinase